MSHFLWVLALAVALGGPPLQWATPFNSAASATKAGGRFDPNGAPTEAGGQFDPNG